MKMTTKTQIAALTAITPDHQRDEQDEPAESSDNTRIIPDGIMLPPPPILWQWLSYIYQTTGEWWLPPSSPALSQVKGASEGKIFKVTKSDRNIEAEGKNSLEEIQAAFHFDYQNSAYFSAALSLIKQHDETATEATYTLKHVWVLGLILAWCHHPVFKPQLSSAFAYNPAEGKNFVQPDDVSNMGSTKRIANGEYYWMTLSRQKCAKELGLRPQEFIEACEWLEARGILQTGDSDSRIVSQESYGRFRANVQILAEQQPRINFYWPARAFQNKMKIYRVEAALLEQFELPPFNFANGESAEEYGKDFSNISIFSGKDNGKTFQNSPVAYLAENTAFDSHSDAGKEQTKSFPTEIKSEAAHDHEVFNFKDSNKTKDKNHVNHVFSKDGRVVAELLPEPLSDMEQKVNEDEKVVSVDFQQAAKLAFLKQDARFEGFTGAKGRVTIDYAPALKLARNPALSLEQLREVYNQVLARWLKGELDNPVGYFHASLKNLGNSSEKRRFAVATSLENKAADKFRVGSAARAGYPRGQRNSEQATARLEEEALSDVCYALPVLGSDKVDWKRLIENEQAANDLWEKVRADDLVGRFKLSSSQLQLLANSCMVVTKRAGQDEEAKPQIVIKLDSMLQLASLNSEIRNIIRIALTQRLGTGYLLHFEHI